MKTTPLIKKFSYFSKMAIVGFQYEPASLVVNKVCFDKEQNIPNTREKSRKSQSVSEWCRCEKCGVMTEAVAQRCSVKKGCS